MTVCILARFNDIPGMAEMHFQGHLSWWNVSMSATPLHLVQPRLDIYMARKLGARPGPGFESKSKV